MGTCDTAALPATGGQAGVEALLDLIEHEPRARELYVRTLELCKERRDLPEVEHAIQGWPQFALAARSPYALVRDLVELGGLDWVELDDEGLEVTPERKEGLTPDEADDLVAGYAVQTTADGADAAEQMAPASRLERLCAAQPERSWAFAEVLGFCEEPRSYAEVAEHLRACGATDSLRATNGQALQPSYFLDMLERAGALVWDGAWKAQEAGLARLAKLPGAAA